MTPEDTLSILTALTTLAVQAERIANALESQPSPAPNITRDLADYPGFDWSTINAEVLQRDKHGAIAVRHSGKVYIRRNPANKYGITIWYSRATGKDGDDTVYETLIRFREIKIEADPLNEKTVELLRRLRAANQATAG